ncbi:hypothetical protein LSTR_LSTR005370 [Laodelphax striatellus]|uniref:Protein HIRA n=1 Tax=Laodelphax striatellus TaxID=195883 RepID=A0A482WQU9_LAOST|nr:hypothetical protein LSTR_LSTR005370 [Laodelphax striatellus]
MRVVKPLWVSHDDMPIFSIDIHPDGSRFATGGQGDDSGRVVIWNMAPVVSEEKEIDENCPKMLCQMDNHQACVNSVRWSYSGKLLASGGDDKLIMVWSVARYPGGGNAVFGSKGKMNVETWRCVATLRGHHGDVLDMAWSPHDTWLASCSVDNTVIIWDANKMPEIVAILKGHSGLVKGVTWDPIGKYLSSQSDDKSIRIWRTADWKQETVINEPFQECSGTTLVLRLGWSPDGQYLVSAHAMNGSGPTARIIERDGWRHGMDFVGHRQAVTCVRFNTNILQNYYKSMNKPLQACCCAIGSRDRSISVWVTALKRPLFAMENLFSRPVLDLSWSSSGLQLMACSGDGTVAYFQFTQKELGTALTVDEKNKLYERLYGKSMAGGCDTSNIAIENPELLSIKDDETKMEEDVCEPEKPQVAPPVVKLPPPPPPPVIVTSPLQVNKQIETRTSDGRRRITPIFIPAIPDTGDGPVPFGSDSMTFSSSSENSFNKFYFPIVKCLSSFSLIFSHQQQTASVVPAAVKRSDSNTQSSRKRPRFADKANCQSDAVLPAQTTTAQPAFLPVPVAATKTPISGHSGALPFLNVTSSNSIPVIGSKNVISVENDTLSSPHGLLTRIRLTNGADSKWDYVFGSSVCACVADTKVLCIACKDRTLHIMDTNNGSHLLPPLALPSPASRLVFSPTSNCLLCLTICGRISVWNLNKKCNIITSQSIAPVLGNENGIHVSQCFLTDDGIPLVALSNGRAYMFSLDMSAWMKVGDVTDPIVKNSQETYQSASKHLQGNRVLPLNRLQSFIQSRSSNRPRSFVQSFETSPPCTMSFLDQQLSACKAMKSGPEYRFWLLTSVGFFLQHGNEDKLRNICQDLLGPSHSTASLTKKWDPKILDLSKHELLKDVLKEIGARVESQRLYTEFKDQLDALSCRNGL